MKSFYLLPGGGGIARRRTAGFALWTLVLFLGSTLMVPAQAGAQPEPELQAQVTLHVQKIRLQDALTQLETQIPYTFTYNHSLLDRVPPVSQDVTNAPLHTVLDALLKNTGLQYQVVGTSIAIAPNPDAAPARSIQGTIYDENDQPLPGANVLIKGTTQGTVTDVNGHFSLTLPEGADVLLVRFIGYLPQEVTVGSRQEIDITLEPDVAQLSEVVVTALGIEREEKALGYAVQTLDNRDLTGAMSTNWANALQGKVPGLSLSSAGSGPLGSQRITLRGDASLNLDNNQALIVLDGVPLNNTINGTGSTAYLQGESPVDYGNTIGDLNPEDIASVSVLKGPTAAALYGSRAANGAIIITTKSGKRQGKGLGIAFNSNTSFENVLRWPDYQYEYGQGTPGQDTWYSYGESEDGPNTRNTSSTWGPRFEGQSYFQYNSPQDEEGNRLERTPWVAYPDNRKDFFQTGVNTLNSLSVFGGNDQTQARLSLTHLNNRWIVPNTGYERVTTSFSLNHNVSERLQIQAKANYVNKQSDNLPTAGYNNQSLMYFIMFQSPNVNLDWYQPYWLPGQEGLVQNAPFSGLIDNPYLQVYEMLNKMQKHNFIGNLSATYHFTDDLSLMVRSGIDFGNDERSQQRPKSTEKFKEGMYREQKFTDYEINSDFLARYHKLLFDRLDFSLSAGGNRRYTYRSSLRAYADRLILPNVYNLANSMDPPVVRSSYAERAINSLYGMAQFALDEKLFLDLTGRNDWSSTLPAGGNSYFYPSASLSAVVSELLPLPQAISFAKVRASWAQVGNDADPYQLRKYYTASQFSGSFENQTFIPNTQLKPEITSSTEFGLDIRLLRGRLGLDVTAYQNNSRNQILEVPIDRASGYNYAVLNAGLITNRGLEIQFNATPIKTERFRWNLTANWAANRNKVVQLADGVETFIRAASIANRVTIQARPGGSISDLYGLGYERAPDGQIVYDEQGYPLLTQEVKKLGNANPGFRAGLYNQFKWGAFGLSVLVDGQRGGDVYSLTYQTGASQGKLTSTIPGRYEGLIGEGVIANGDGTYRPNDIVAEEIGTYYGRHYNRNNVESSVFDASFLKVREARFDYTIPAQITRKIHVEKINLGLYGRNLLLFTSFPAYDPEAATLNDGSIVPGIETGQFPSTRTIGIDLNITL
ncbi:TonB-linked outer membrane protein, SusC/RagA family [Catalinimonas alkaloidigena]|uniref:TonB-linked outer membrane protein, SusC/RagA family n=1 Tax=Catalinimonas alkaloidigena TaxID=1075417 RepID=A0A1G9HJG0_9BACT|nr:SusC/RagA family TonB-linked outer membrane protein [Catalinimonas alkaloidigena]SDL13059.1 TonB-linked outer membrane protein, SusC/RagA family [Catalinimonas alkaloidigena]